MATTALHQVFVDTITYEHDCVLQFDLQCQVLRSWLWPKNHSGSSLAPKDLRNYRASHHFLGPCCLCPALLGEGARSFTEAAMCDRGDGEFVVMCPTDDCSYLAFLGHIFQRGNMPMATYAKRDNETIKPPRVFHQSEDVANVFRKACFYEMTCVMPTLPPTRRVLPCPVTYHDCLHKLNSRVRPGIPENTMKLLFIKCAKCGKVTTRHVFLYHFC